MEMQFVRSDVDWLDTVLAEVKNFEETLEMKLPAAESGCWRDGFPSR